ncbi:transmembrane protein 177 [Nilaparvata lugens]|uniref:transmembrane protein 177 n=1 Tax=Nilaparvata lugens TaxID=108931 RepID=UPI00193D9BDF|nr:transmembrane protein 177 [Nilaparvata lugens]XP_039301585.1 transmembrane protein 177 [Nilaparvata lugens]
MSRLWNYALSYGQRNIVNCLGSIGCGTALLSVFSHTIFVDNYKGLFEIHRKGFPLKVNEELNNILSDVSDDMHLGIRDPKVELFYTIGQNLSLFGTAWSNCTCYIGLPINFSYKTVKDVDETIMVGNKKVDWDTKEGNKLKESLVLSKQAMKYAIAHELKIAHGPIIYLNASYPILIIISLMAFNNSVIDRIIYSRNPRFYMKAFYTSLAVLGLGFYFLLKDCTTKYFELKSDKELAETSEEYLLGGIEFLEKQLLMNTALRDLLPDGRSEYTAEGEEIHLFRRKHSPIIERLRIFKKELDAQRLRNKESSSSTNVENSIQSNT